MSCIFTLIDAKSTLSTDFPTPVVLDSDSSYGLALLGFYSYNSIPNIEEGKNNKFYYYEKSDKTKKEKVIEIPTGSYEVEDIEKYIQNQLPPAKNEKVFYLHPNLSRLTCEIFSSRYGINFTPKDCIGRLLGFSEKHLQPNVIHESDLPVDIVKVRTVHIDSNITGGAYYNNRPSHTIYEFAISVDPGYAINKEPKNLVYLPVNVSEIRNITLKILDQNFEEINFRKEIIIVRLELKKLD
jgi:hypothetical protein